MQAQVILMRKIQTRQTSEVCESSPLEGVTLGTKLGDARRQQSSMRCRNSLGHLGAMEGLSSIQGVYPPKSPPSPPEEEAGKCLLIGFTAWSGVISGQFQRGLRIRSG